MKMKECELCDSIARVFCESDEAGLCWNCDEKVHSANFLVSKHLRNLLCYVCQSLTLWKASGSKVGRPMIFVCQKCIRREGGSNDDNDDQASENEVFVTNTTTTTMTTTTTRTLLPPPVSSSSEVESLMAFSLKRIRNEDVVDLDSQDNLCCSSSRVNYGLPLVVATTGRTTRTRTTTAFDDDATSASPFRPPYYKKRKKDLKL